MGPTDFNFVTPEEAYRLRLLKSLSLKRIKRIANNNNKCENCDQHVWRYGQTGLCFPCTTGESDASEDYEIGNPYV